MKRVLMSLCVALVLAAWPARSALDLYLQVSGIIGDLQIQGHVGWMEVQSFNLGVSNPVTVTTSVQGGRATQAVFTVAKEIDRASPALLLLANQGSNATPVTVSLDVLDSGNTQQPGGVFYKVYMEGAYVKQVSQSSEGGLTAEAVSFAYSRIRWIYYPRTGGAAVSNGWNVVTNQPF